MSSHASSLILYKLYIYDSKFPTLYIGHGALLSVRNLHVPLHKYTVAVQIVPRAVDTYQPHNFCPIAYVYAIILDGMQFSHSAIPKVKFVEGNFESGNREHTKTHKQLLSMVITLGTFHESLCLHSLLY